MVLCPVEIDFYSRSGHMPVTCIISSKFLISVRTGRSGRLNSK